MLPIKLRWVVGVVLAIVAGVYVYAKFGGSDDVPPTKSGDKGNATQFHKGLFGKSVGDVLLPSGEKATLEISRRAFGDSCQVEAHVDDAVRTELMGRNLADVHNAQSHASASLNKGTSVIQVQTVTPKSGDYETSPPVSVVVQVDQWGGGRAQFAGSDYWVQCTDNPYIPPKSKPSPSIRTPAPAVSSVPSASSSPVGSPSGPPPLPTSSAASPTPIPSGTLPSSLALGLAFPLARS